MSDDPLASPYAHAPLAVAQAFVDGRAAGAQGERPSCPHADGSHEHGAWHRGYRLGVNERVSAV